MATGIIGSTNRATTETDARLRQASAALGVPFVRLASRTIPRPVLERIPLSVAHHAQMVAYEESRLPSGRRVLRLAVADPALLEHEAPAVITELHARQGMVIEVALTTPEDVASVLARYPKQKSAISPSRFGERGRGDQQSSQPVAPPVQLSAVPKQIDLRHRTIPREALERIPEETARKYRIVVFDLLDQGRTIHVGLEQPDNPQVQELLTFLGRQNNLTLVPFAASPASIDAALAQYHGLKSPLAKLPKLSHTKPGSKAPTPESLSASRALRPIPKVAGDELRSSRPAPTKKLAAGVKPAAQPAPKAEAHTAPTEPAPPPAVRSVGEIRPDELRIPDLHVPPPAGAGEPQSLIPLAADVERDMRALVGQDVTSVDGLENMVRTGFIPKIVGAILLFAVHREASDVHIQAAGEQLLVRFRIDGILQDIIKIPGSLQAPIISRIKILARLKIDEARIPQDGRFDIVVGEREIDLRVSTFPTVYGEKVVMRLLDKSVGLLTFDTLGLLGSRLARLKQEIAKPYGVILATGPTGSGKSTLLYAILTEIATPAVNVVTLEDPVEYEIPGISQAQIQPKIGFGFAEGLRSILRQDPNIIMVGEIRDVETASLVTHAALTGHLVLSTLHTNDAAGALPRLINMGVEPFLITSAMNAVVAQRLVRRLCETCRVPWQPPAELGAQVLEKLRAGNQAELTDLTKDELKLWKAKGCDDCHDGYKGRVGIFEVLLMSDPIEALAVKKAPASDIAHAAIAEGMVTMEQDGIVKALSGITTLDEVLRVTKAE